MSKPGTTSISISTSNSEAFRVRGRDRVRSRVNTWLALLIRCLGAAVMVYPYLYAVGGSLKSRSEFATDKQAIVPPRYQPARLFQRFVAHRPDLEEDRQLRDWPPHRNYVDAVVYGGIDRFLCNSFLYAVVVTTVSLFFNVLAA